jgi:hypothetical protein
MSIRTCIAASVFAVLAVTGCGKKDRKVGITQCDALIERIQACSKKVGGEIADGFDKAVDVWVDQWKEAAEQGETKRAELGATCDGMRDELKRDTRLAQCEW